MKSYYRKVFTEKRNPGCKGKYYKRTSSRSRKHIERVDKS